MRFCLFCLILSILTFSARSDSAVQKTKDKLNLKAESLDFVNGNEGEREIFASGGVEADYTNYNLSSDELEINEKTDTLKAKGNVVLKEKIGGFILKTDETTSNKTFIKAEIDKFTFERGRLHGDGESGEKQGDVMTFKEFAASTCKSGKDGGVSEWKVKAKTASYNQKTGDVKLKNTIFYVKDIPVFWFPVFSINSKRKHGFLEPKVGYGNGSFNIATPYFITDEERYHYFVFTPQFFIYNTSPPRPRVNNFQFNYDYNRNDRSFKFDYKIAPNAYIQNNQTGILENEQSTRHNLFVSLQNNYNVLGNGKIGFNYYNVSDRFFRRTYNNQTENYLTSNISINHLFSSREGSDGVSGKNYFILERAHFTPISFVKNDSNPKIDAYLNSMQYFDFGKKIGLEFYNNPNFLVISRDIGISQSRFSNSIGFTYNTHFNTNFGKIKTSINPEFRFDFYKTNNSGINIQNAQNQSTSRAIPSLFIQNEMPIYFKNKLNGDYLFNITPKVNFQFMPERLNKKSISNEDSAIPFLSAENILLKQAAYGYDRIQEGLSASYGFNFGGQNFKNGSNFEFFLGQRARMRFEDQRRPHYSSYVFGGSFAISDSFSINSNIVINSNNNVEYAKSGFTTNLFGVKFSFTNLFIEKSLIKTDLNVKINTFEVAFNIPKTNLGFKTNLVQNNNFRTINGKIQSKIVESNFGIFSQRDCFKFEVGLKRRAYSTDDLEKGYQIYGSLMIIGL